MLQAIIRKKPLSGNSRRLTDDVRNKKRGDFSEDAITATVFGPLRYMATEDAWTIVCATLLKSKYDVVQNIKPECHELDFWPLGARDECEPDLVFKFCDKSDPHPLTILLEVKWNAYLHDGQLAEQRKLIFRRDGVVENRLIQLYLAKSFVDTRAVEQLREVNKCRAIAWSQIADAVNRLLGEPSSTVQNWANDIKRFFEHVGVAPFDRFGPLTCLAGQVSACIVREWRLDYWAFGSVPKALALHDNELQTIKQWRVA